MKLQLIYSFYIADNLCNNEIYEMHFNMLTQISSLFDKISIIIVHNGNEDDDIIYRVRARLIESLNFKNLSFIYEQNIPELREGAIYKKYIIDKLGDYDDYLTFFGHTKGVSNQFGLSNIDNLKLWIFSMYYLNFKWLSEVKQKLNTYTLNEDYMTYGSLYFKNFRHNNIHNWFYAGSFYWLNTYKINKYIKDNNIDLRPFEVEENERLMRCAELFPGSILNESYCGFHKDENFDKTIDMFNEYGWEISYTNISLMLENFLTPDEYSILLNDYNNLSIF